MPSRMINRIDELNRYVMRKIGNRIKTIGKLSAAEVNTLLRSGAFDMDLIDIKNEAAKIVKKNLNEIDEIFDIAREKHHDFTSKYFAKRGIDSSDLSFLNDYVKDVKNATKEQYLKISKTIGFEIDGEHNSLQKVYQEAIGKAVRLVTSGEKNYKNTIRETIKKLGESGLKAVEYKNGTIMNLENAVKINVSEHIREVNAGMSKRAGEKFGSDGVEISMHPNSAPDHEDIQGRQFTHEEFNKLQSQQPFKDVTGRRFAAIKRPIGMWNCGHYVFEIIIGATQPVYDEERLQRYKLKNAKGFAYEGEKYTGYEAEQMQNRIKFEWRKARGAFTIAESAGDMELANGYRYRMTVLQNHYVKFSKAAEEFYREPLTNFEESGIIDKKVHYAVYKNETDIPETFKHHADGITAQEKEAIREYTSNLHVVINRAARSGIEVGDLTDPKYDKYLKEKDKSLSDLLERSHVPENVTVWRGTTLKTFSQKSILSKLLIEDWEGQIIDDKAFVSTSILERGANKDKEVFMEILVPKGTKGLYVNEVSVYKDLEFELLLQKGTKFHINEVKKENGKTFLQVEVRQ